ncbi:RE2 [Symbiodinium sp. KB8]|nr:RE2 [Symbiodinium sp. KB8]
MATPSGGGVPLDEWRKDVPPGWKPGVDNYPLKTYFAKLKLWYRCCEVPDEVIGPLIAGRLQGRAQRIALELKLVRPDGSYDYGDAALVRLSVDEVLDPNDGVTVLQAHIPSGVQALCNALRDLQEFAAEWDLRYEDARSKAGLEMNTVAKSYLWLKASTVQVVAAARAAPSIQAAMSAAASGTELYYADQEEADFYYNDTNQLRHARQGLSLGDSPKKQDNAKYFNIATDIAPKSEYFEDLLRLERAHKPSQEGAGSAEEQSPTQMPKKTIDFFFRKTDNDPDDDEVSKHRTYHEQATDNEVYHTVGGQRRRGLVIDPGAANGLVGSETLRDLLEHVIPKAPQWTAKKSEVTGISGEADSTLGEIKVSLPNVNGLEDANYRADVIGGNASMCPALVGNPSLVNMRAIIAANWFENKDGLLAVPKDDGGFQMIRLLLTDSKHYLLPLDVMEETLQDTAEEEKVKTFVTAAHEETTRRWKDVRSWFTWATTAKPKRSQSNFKPTVNEEGSKVFFDESPSPTATLTTPGHTTEDIGATKNMDSLVESPSPTATTTPDDTTEDIGANNIMSCTTSHPGSYESTSCTTSHPEGPLSPVTQEVAYDDEMKFGLPEMYPGDVMPPDLPQEQVHFLRGQHQAVKEEFYSKSGRAVIGPDNYERWRETRHAKKRPHFWEIGSGSGRLTYTALLAGLIVAFPVDYRYGWNLADPEHQRMLLEEQQRTSPSMIFFSPPGSQGRVSKEDQAAQQRDHHNKLSIANFAKTMAMRQAEAGHGFVLQGLWNSSWWTSSPLAGLEHQLEGFRPRQRSDLCAYGAVSDNNRPIQQMIGLQGNLSLRAATHRCRGHQQRHVPGLGERARRYPPQLCKSLVKDVKKFVNHTTGAKFIGYKCEKCKLGKNAPPGTEHSMIPRECRHASSLPTPTTSSNPSSSSNQPPPAMSSAPVRTAVTTPMNELLEQFKQKALKQQNLDIMKLQLPDDMTMTAVDTIMLKSLLVQLVEDSVNIISEKKTKHHHWSQDPLHLAILRKLFGKIMTVKGVSTSLHVETLPLPMPFLRTDSAPLRLIIRGEVKAWTVKPLEDLRTYTDSQLKAKCYSEDWIIAIFGAAPKDKDYWDIDRARGTATRHHLQPRTSMFTPREDEGPVTIDELRSSRVTMATPFDKPGPKVVIRDEWTSRDSSRAAMEQGRWTGTTEFQIKLDEDDNDVPADPVLREAEAHEDALDREEADEPQAAELEPEDGSPVDPPRRTNFDFRRVLVRLPRLARTDAEQAKRLILGLHERFWHSGTSDLQSLLSRAGMPAEVMKLVPEVVSGCAICRRFARLKSRPAVKSGHPAFFNEEVQADYFQLWDQWFLILVDACTRYKMVTSVAGRDLSTALKTMMQNWIRFFGPMKRLVSDQESCLMSHEAAVEFERLNIQREPAGTTRGKAQGQHTTTGIVEKHIDLVKLCMLKIKSETERQGLDISNDDIAAEASFAQNASINLGGYTPHMMVMGTLPMPYFDMDAPGIQAFTGSDQTNPTAYEKALRLRQLAITAAAQSIAENRIARAAHTRPQRLPTEDMKPGVTEIEFHREDADGYGWRGPGLLLKLQDNGSAIIEYQGRPYLVPLRSVRIFRGNYYSNFATEGQERKQQELDSWLALRRLMESVEACVPFRIDTYGHVKDNHGNWKVLPKTMNEPQRQGILEDIVLAARFLTSKACHGIKVGVGLKKMLTPALTTGTLVAWRRHTIRMTIVDNPKGHNMSTVPLRLANKEEMCYLYFYSYEPDFAEVPLSTWRPKGIPNEESPIVPRALSPDAPMETEENQDMEVDVSDNKRLGPESRTVVMAPETKKQRTSFVLSPAAHMQETFLVKHRQRHLIRLQEPDAQPPEDLQPQALDRAPDASAIFHMHSPGWCADIHVGNIFRVDSSTDNIEEHQVFDIWPQVEAADEKEVSQFVAENAFKAVLRNDLGKDCAIIDAIWVRKWKKTATERIVKSRLCVRGCHDPWKHELSSRSSTATRLSQRMILTSASNDVRKVLESWDIAGAFLKGLTYQELWKALKELGLQCVERLIAIVPPRNVWRHLRKLSKKFDIPEHRLHEYVLLCLKPVYGLSEAPLAWQLYLHKYLKQLGACQSHFDECYWWWPSPTHGDWPRSSVSTHVDDLAVEGYQKWLDEIFEKMMKKFGKLTRQRLPFMHCGCRYSKIADGYKVDQMEYVEMLKPVKVPREEKDDRQLTPPETTLLRSAIGALMWTGLTRPDLLAELSVLQGVMNKAQVRHLRSANDLVAKAKKDKEAAIYYRNLNTTSYRIVCIHDASAASSTKNYAQEGVIVVLMSDHFRTDENHVTVDDYVAKTYLSGQAQLLHCQSNKAKRVSYSTSHGETLAAINGLECATLVSTRLAEATYAAVRPSLQQLLAIQERGCHHFPVDMHTDARDFWELSTGTRALPQDKSQRLYILAHREARATGRIRWVILTPTECMTADALTKVMISPVLMVWLTTGVIKFWNTGHSLEMKRLPPTDTIVEQDLIDGDISLQHKPTWFSTLPVFMFSKKLFGLMLATTLVDGAAAQPHGAPQQPFLEFHDVILLTLMVLLSISAAALAVCCDRMMIRTTSTATTTSSATSTTPRPTTTTSSSTSCTPMSAEPLATTSRHDPPPAAPLSSDGLPVWVRQKGHCYHTKECIYAQGGRKLTPCGFCNPQRRGL